MLVQAVALTTLAIVWMMLSYIVLAMVLPQDVGAQTVELLYEVVSAFSTAGTSMGITGDLNTAGKSILCVVMFTGRVGLMTIAYGLTRKASYAKNTLAYPEGRVMIG